MFCVMAKESACFLRIKMNFSFNEIISNKVQFIFVVRKREKNLKSVWKICNHLKKRRMSGI